MKRSLYHSVSHTDKHNIKYLGWVLYCCKIHKIGNICKLSKFLNILIFQEIILAKRGSNCSLEIWDFAVRVEVHHMLNNLNSKSILYNLTIFEVGGAVEHPLPKISSKTLKKASKWPQISWLFLFLNDLSEKQKKILFFHSDFGCLEGGSGKPPRHLTYIFNPVPNRVKNHSLGKP